MFIPPKSQFRHLIPHLQPINIFSTAWVLKYGVPTTHKFLCRTKKNPIYGYGIITAINKGAIRVRGEDGEINALYLGVCSELEGVEKNFVPVIGDLVEFDGDQVITGIVNIHKARLFRN